MDRSTKGWRWRAVAGLLRADVEQANVVKRSFERQYPLASIRTYQRGVRAGGYTFTVIAIVARVKDPCCTCGEAYGAKRPAYLGEPCDYCKRPRGPSDEGTGASNPDAIVVDTAARHPGLRHGD